MLERARFLAIFGRNLDEFFQIRVSGLREQLIAGVEVTSPDGMTPREQLDAIRARVQELVARQLRVFEKRVRPQLSADGLRIMDWADLKKAQRDELEEVFDKQVFPVLTRLPSTLRIRFRTSRISLSTSPSSFATRRRGSAVRARQVPPRLPRFLKLSGQRRFILLEQVIAAHLDRLFPGMKIVDRHPFRVTRDADVEIEVDEADDLLVTLESLLRGRQRSPEAVRLEVTASMPQRLRSILLRELRLTPSEALRLRRAPRPRRPLVADGVEAARTSGAAREQDCTARPRRAAFEAVRHPLDTAPA